MEYKYSDNETIRANELFIDFCPEFIEFDFYDVVNRASSVHGMGITAYTDLILSNYVGSDYAKILRIEGNPPTRHILILTDRGKKFKELKTFSNFLQWENKERAYNEEKKERDLAILRSQEEANHVSKVVNYFVGVGVILASDFYFFEFLKAFMPDIKFRTQIIFLIVFISAITAGIILKKAAMFTRTSKTTANNN